MELYYHPLCSLIEGKRYPVEYVIPMDSWLVSRSHCHLRGRTSRVPISLHQCSEECGIPLGDTWNMFGEEMKLNIITYDFDIVCPTCGSETLNLDTLDGIELTTRVTCPLGHTFKPWRVNSIVVNFHLCTTPS